ncbi:hypothetical protein FSARC_9737 [Fusarium sarcochroum]|uniref:Amidase domain-containing protein n=1 Tax=Fusarium sarcochroum TaxID=1208366 RepID=A0A8H4X517_9HYPO|nr:hypothetical protein FSARC_9737 [Fusarium sarcochroum]
MFFASLALAHMLSHLAVPIHAYVFQTSLSVVTLGNLTYYIAGEPVVGLKHIQGFDEPSNVPLTSFVTNETSITAQVLTGLYDRYLQDDVWSPHFLDAIALQSPPRANFTSGAYAWLVKHHVKYLFASGDIQAYNSYRSIAVLPILTLGELKPGPYMLSSNELGAAAHEVYRLYADDLQAFTEGIVPVVGTNDTFTGLSLQDSATTNLLLPVPSRLYSLFDTRPLAGFRTVVKDLFHVKGLKTGGGSRVSLEMYAAQNESAVAVTKLLELGAVPIGKTKLSQFAWGIEPWKWNDYKYPWNPRGDGWLEVAFSSSGSGAAIAGYDWIDFALGSDTGGSVRMPAALGGSYGIRPTHDAMNLTGALPLSGLFDTAGIFARDPVLFSHVNKHWYTDGPVSVNKSFESFPRKLLYPTDYFPLESLKAQKVFDSFIGSLEKELGMKAKKVNITSILHASDNVYINSKSLTESLFSTALRWDSWNGIGKDLVARWKASYPKAGFPPLDLESRLGYAAHDTVNKSIYEEVVKHKAEFAAYVQDRVLRPSDATCSESILILESGASGRPCYREEFLNHEKGAGFLYMTDPKPWLNPLLLSPLLSAPQISIPIGQVDYDSPISFQVEKLPIVIDLMAYPGCDNMLMGLVETLAEKGIIKTVKVGKTAF